MLTPEQIKNKIKALTAQREQAVAEANRLIGNLSGKIEAYNEMLESLETPEEIISNGIGELQHETD